MSDVPGDPFKSIAEAAMQLHELFISLIEGGFTERQALFIIADLMRPKSE